MTAPDEAITTQKIPDGAARDGKLTEAQQLVLAAIAAKTLARPRSERWEPLHVGDVAVFMPAITFKIVELQQAMAELAELGLLRHDPKRPRFYWLTLSGCEIVLQLVQQRQREQRLSGHFAISSPRSLGEVS